MVRVESFILVGDELLPFDKFEGSVPDSLYVEGAIHLEINGTVVISLEMWDLVDQLWAYIAQGLETLTTEASWSTSFPDMPVKLTFKTDARRQHVHVEVYIPKQQHAYIEPSGQRHEPQPARRVSASAEYNEFTQVMCEAGRRFFDKMIELVPQKEMNYRKQLARLESASSGGVENSRNWVKV